MNDQPSKRQKVEDQKTSIGNDHLVLGVDQEYKFFLEKIFYEPVDIKRFTDVLQCDQKVLPPSTWTSSKGVEVSTESKRAHLVSVMENYSMHEKAIEVQYRFAESSPFSGRVYPHHGASAGEINGELRSYLLEGLWTAFDIENAHPNIAYQVLSANGMSDEFCALSQYCTNREQTLDAVKFEYSVGRKDAKLLFIRLLYGGTFVAWARERGFDFEPTEFIKSFESEMANLLEVVVKANPRFASRITANDKTKKPVKKKLGRPPKKAKKGVDDDTVKASSEQVLANWMAEQERRALKFMYDYLVGRGLIDDDHPECMLRFDGIDLPLSKLDGVDKEEVLRGMSQSIKDGMDIDLMVTEKVYTESELKAEIETQLDYASRVSEKYKDELDMGELIDLRDYAAQKWYFEQFVSAITDSSNYAVIQRRYMERPKGYDGVQTVATDNAVAKTARELSESFRQVQTVFFDENDDKPRKSPFIKKWLDDENRRVCRYLDFVPFNKDIEDFPGSEHKVFNVFKGFSIPTGVTLTKGAREYTSAFHYIGLQLCENDPVKYQFFWNCIVSQFKSPRDRLRMAFVFQGKTQGSGFDVYMDTIGRLLGNNHYTNTARISDLVGEHAEGLEHRLLVVANEVKFRDLNGSEDVLKGMITAEKYTVNPKCVRPYSINMYALLVFASNHQNAISYDNDDNERRFNVFAPTNHCVYDSMRDENWGFDSEAWGYNVSLFKSPTFLHALYQDIMTTDIEDFDQELVRPRVLGAEYFRSSERNSKTHAKFFADGLRNGVFDKYAARTMASANSVNKPWVINQVGRGVDVEIVASQLHDMFFNYMDAAHKVTARQDKSAFKDLFSGKGPYSKVIDSYRNNERMYRFNTRKLWMVLIEKKWVEEAHSYFSYVHKDVEFAVDERFAELGKLMETTPKDERGTVNPGNNRV